MQDLFAVKYAILIPLLPLIGAVIAGFFGAKWLKGNSHWPIWIGVGCSALISFTLLFGTIRETNKATQAAGEGVNSSTAMELSVSTVKNYFTWIEAGSTARPASQHFIVMWGYFFDPLTAVMLCVVCGIGFFITVFAAGYMKGETGYFRFFAYLGLFIFMMTNLVMGENLIMLYLGWEGVGLSSYLLIGYYYDKPAAREAAKKAFLVNRVGDFGFALGIMLTFLAFGTVSYFGDGVNAVHNKGFLEMALHPSGTMQIMAMKWVPFLLMVGAFGKSAQFPLYVWLPDAMEGPTPVSALIHAATMVTAGIYMIARCGTMFVGNQSAMVTIAVVGAFTALFAATIALRQFDLKKVFAYSTVSQLGFMFVGVGVLAPVAGVFHLITHAFFKALLFLSSGVVMHAMAGELDMRKFSGLKRQLPKTRILMLIGCLALAGFPLTAGFFSKDEIVAYAWYHSKIAGGVLLLTAFLTAYYTFRLYFRVFEGPEILPPAPVGGHGHDTVDTHLVNDPHHGGATTDAHGHDAHGAHDHGHHNHEPALMMIPLFVLAIGALVAGFYPGGERLSSFLGHSPSFIAAYDRADASYNKPDDKRIAFEALGRTERQEEFEKAEPAKFESEKSLHHGMMLISGLISIAGIFLAYVNHLKSRENAEKLAAAVPGLTNAIEHKYWVDEIYQAVIVEPLRAVGKLFFAVDRFIVDGIVWLVGFVPQLSGFLLKLTTQRGYLQGYAASMLLGIAIILLLIFR